MSHFQPREAKGHQREHAKHSSILILVSLVLALPGLISIPAKAVENSTPPAGAGSLRQQDENLQFSDVIAGIVLSAKE